jgi:GAF domain-containing protein
MASLFIDCGLAEIRSILCVPVIIRDKVFGLIHLWNREHDSFTSHDEKVTRWVAAHLAIAVESAAAHPVHPSLPALKSEEQ